jgi:hypothetical protein
MSSILSCEIGREVSFGVVMAPRAFDASATWAQKHVLRRSYQVEIVHNRSLRRMFSICAAKHRPNAGEKRTLAGRGTAGRGWRYEVREVGKGCRTTNIEVARTNSNFVAPSLLRTHGARDEVETDWKWALPRDVWALLKEPSVTYYSDTDL